MKWRPFLTLACDEIREHIFDSKKNPLEYSRLLKPDVGMSLLWDNQRRDLSIIPVELPPSSHTQALLAVSTTCLFCAWICAVLRFGTRTFIVRAFGKDDLTLFAALACIFSLTYLTKPSNGVKIIAALHSFHGIHHGHDNSASR
jgi:hypothetical protein